MMVRGAAGYAGIAASLLSAATVSVCNAQIPVERVLPSQANPRVKAYDYPDVVLNGGAAMRGAPLVVFLPGTGSGATGGPHALEETLAEQGYRVIFLPYDNLPPGNQLCPRRPPQCYERFRASRIFGGDAAPIATPSQEAIVSRLAAVLVYLEQTHPDAGWGDYLTPSQAPKWSNIVVSGLSQGAGMAALIAKRFAVRRVVLFSSPWDEVGPDKQPAPWLYAPPATPLNRWWAERHARENTTQWLANAYRALGIPADHQLVFDGPLPASAAGENPYHGSTVTLPGYAPQWKAMFGLPGAPPD